MKISSKFLSSVFLAVVCASGVFAAPWAQESKLATHRVREISPSLTSEYYHPASTYETFGEMGVEHALTKRAGASIEDSARAFIVSKLGVSDSDIHFRSSYSAQTARHVYMRQLHNGIPFSNAVANVALSYGNKVVAFGSSFVKPTKIASSTPKLTAEEAISKAEGLLDGKYNEWPTTLEYVVKADNTAALAHVVQIQNDRTGIWYEAFVNAHSGELDSVTDFVSHATYRVLPISKQAPVQGFETLVNPEDLVASPYGWISVDGVTQQTTTVGNNADASASGIRAPQSAPGEFVYTQVPTSPPTTTVNKYAATVNAFYIINSVHDITYRYGFNEASYNFQQNNRGLSGAAADRVRVLVQDTSATNSDSFATPADGQPGQMRISLWTYANPPRDGAFENDLVVHENMHGVSSRLTGGGTARCLQTTEAGGLDYIMGQYVTNSAAGIRSHPYSTSVTINPYRYSTLKTQNEVHAIGEVWANILHNVLAALVASRGFDAAAKTMPASTAGNAVWLHLLIDSLALQPCNPTFVTARDAWIQADANRYAGANKCVLWTAFASRGLGVGAASYTDSSAVPSGC